MKGTAGNWKKKITAILLVLVLSGGVCAVPVAVQAVETGTVIRQTQQDTKVIPDAYNTKAVEPSQGYTQIERGSTFEVTNDAGKKMKIVLQDAGTEQKINLQYANRDVEGTIVFENVDFSATMDKFTILGTASREENHKKVNFVFKNCVFKEISTGREGYDYVHFTFENCTIESFWGSNVTMKRCYFGGGINDRLNPFCKVTVQDCYIANPTSEIAADGEIHVDGTQMYGWKTTQVYDVRFTGCRFEMPAVSYPNAPKTYVNACIMLQLEYNDGHDIAFSDCYVNGGGYSVYASQKNDCKYEDTYFQNLKFGCAAHWGKIYPKQSPGVTLNQDTWTDADAVYVGTVKRDKEAKKILLSVSNDTNKERTFRVYTSLGKSYDFTIDACPKWSEFNNRKFEEFPFDRIYTIPEDADWIVCYETTEGAFNQVRYVNWGQKELILTKDANGQPVIKEKVEATTTEAVQKPEATTEAAVQKPETTTTEAAVQKPEATTTEAVVQKPEDISIGKIIKKKRKFVIKWKQSEMPDLGYQIQISTSKKFKKKKTKTFTIKRNAVTRKTVKKLKVGKRYYIRIRTYRKTVGKEAVLENAEIYGRWSHTKMKKCR